MPKKKLNIVQVMECTIGGTRRHIRELSSGLSMRGHSVTAVCSSVRDPTFMNDMEQMRQAGVKVVELPMLRAISPVTDTRHLLFLRRLLKQKPAFDLVHTHSSKAGVLGRVAGLWAGELPLVHTPHTFAFAFKGHFHPLKRALFMFIERFLGKRTSRMINVSGSEREEALGYGIITPDRISVVENGIIQETFEQAALPEENARVFQDRTLSPRLGTVGLLNAAKGHDILIQAFASLLKRFPHAGLAVVGEGALRPSLERLIHGLGLQGRVILAGYRTDIPSVLKELDLFVFPSLWEGMPYVVLEAMASGLPVVATDVNGSRDLVLPGQTGLIVPPSDSDALADACAEILDDEGKAQSMSRQAIQRVREHYTLEMMLEKTEAVYYKIVEERKSC
ncbi:MAG: glycosyltransferase family 4 protein [Planctomycetota bacterium]